MPITSSRQTVMERLGPLLTLVPALTVGALFCMILALLLGLGPFELITALWDGAWGSADAVASSLSKITPLLLTGLAVGLAYRAGLLNIGCEGQLTLGALAAATIAIAAAPLPQPLQAPLTIVAGALIGGLWAFPAVWLRRRFAVHEVVSTLLMNYVAIFLADYLARGPLGDGTGMARTAAIPSGSVWPSLWQVGTLGLTAAPLLALLFAVSAQLWLSRTCWGYEVTAVGSNPVAAKAAGIPVALWQARTFVLSGALAGMAGALEVVAVHHRFYAAFSPGYGFDGITVAFLVNNVPGWFWLSALLLASLRSADKWLQLALGVSPNAILVLEAVLLLAVACQVRLGLRRGADRSFRRSDDVRPSQ